MSIEILEHTLLKLLVRSGPLSDLLNTTLSVGELGYTTDTKRLYVGDGLTPGGRLVGNIFKGSSTDVTTLAPASVGDLALDTDNRKLYRLNSGSGSLISDWELVAGIYVAGSGINISQDNVISTKLLSAGDIDQNAIKHPVILDTGKIALSSAIPLDRIALKTQSHLTLPATIQSNNVAYTMPSSAPVNTFLKVFDNSGTLTFSSISASDVSTNTLTITNGLTARIGNLDITGTAVNPLTSNIVMGVSPTLSSSNILASYNGTSDVLMYSKGISSVTKLATGHYQFNYTSGTSNLVAISQIYGSYPNSFQSRVTEITNSACVVRVFNLNTPADAEIMINISS
jgi:hypothetical protein